MMKTINQLWLEYWSQVSAKQPSIAEHEEVFKVAFYSGALVMLTNVKRALSYKKQRDRQQSLDDLVKEMGRFFKIGPS